MKYYVYILSSLKDGHMYIGFTNNLKRRIKEHNSRKVKSTKGRRPFKLIYFEEYNIRKEAIIREKELKSGQWREIIKEYI